jgi:hypothetical protein
LELSVIVACFFIPLKLQRAIQKRGDWGAI